MSSSLTRRNSRPVRWSAAMLTCGAVLQCVVGSSVHASPVVKPRIVVAVPAVQQLSSACDADTGDASPAPRYLVRYNDSITTAKFESDAKAGGGSVRSLKSTRIGIIEFRGKGKNAAAAALRTLRNSGVISLCEVDQTISLAPPRVSSAAVSPQSARSASAVASWGIDRLDQRALPLDSAYSLATTGAGVDVYVVDTGVRSDHQEFVGRLKSGFAISALGTTDDCNGHGTHVAGTVAGATVGVAPGASVIPVRILDCNGSGSLSGFLEAIDWVVEHHGATPAVMNLSLGGDASALLDASIQKAVNDGITVVVAAGNAQDDACKYSPARSPMAISVAATTIVDRRASFSNYGDCVDVFAPGADIVSAWWTTSSATAVSSGTSMAAPHVSGVAARVLSAHADYSPSQVSDSIRQLATANVIVDARSTANYLLYADPAARVVVAPTDLPASGNSGSVTAAPDAAPSTTEGASGAGSLPQAISRPRAVAGDRSVTISWDDARNSDLIGHVVRVYRDGALVKTVNASSSREALITDLRAAARYQFDVAPVNGAGLGAFSQKSNVATPVRIIGKRLPDTQVQKAPAAAPKTPRNLRVVRTKRFLGLQWRHDPADETTNTDFELEILSATRALIARVTVSDWHGITLGGLKKGAYRVRVRAVNSVGTSPFTAQRPVRLR